MKCRWPDGRAITVTPTGELLGDRRISLDARIWATNEAIHRGGIAVTPTGPFVLADDPLALFTAVNAIAPGGEWSNPPDLTFGAPEDAIF
jgi:hypothetical protein